MIPVNLNPDTEQLLRRRASSLGLDIEAYLRRILETGGKETTAHLSVEEFDKALDALARDVPGTSLPADFSRADFYNDHD